VKQDGGPTDLAQHVIAARVVVDQVTDDAALVGLGSQVVFDLSDSTI
jgi:hypothetical protein